MSDIPLSDSFDYDWTLRVSESALRDGCAWAGDKFVANVKEHRRRYPAFKYRVIVREFIDATPRKKQWMAYQKMSELNNKQRLADQKRRSFSAFCRSQA